MTPQDMILNATNQTLACFSPQALRSAGISCIQDLVHTYMVCCDYDLNVTYREFRAIQQQAVSNILNSISCVTRVTQEIR